MAAATTSAFSFNPSFKMPTTGVQTSTPTSTATTPTYGSTAGVQYKTGSTPVASPTTISFGGLMGVAAPTDPNAHVQAISDAHKQTMTAMNNATRGSSISTTPPVAPTGNSTTGGSSTPPPPPPPPPPAGNPYVAPLASAATSGSPTAQGYTASLMGYGAGNIPIGQSAKDIAAAYGQRIADVGAKGAQLGAGELTGMGTSPVAQGNAAITANATAQQQTALAQGEQAALAGTAQQLTAQQQAAGAANEAAGQAYTGQGQTITGLSNAAGYSQPIPTAFGQTTFNPATGQFSGDAGGYINQWASYLAQGGDPSVVPASISGNLALMPQLMQAVKAQNPNWDINTALGAAGGRQALGGAAAQGQATGITSAASAGGQSAASLTQLASSIQATANGAEANFNLMTNLAKEGGVNDNNVPILNTLQQNVQRGLTSSAAVANFQSLIQSVRSQYASILGGGTVTVEALQEAQSLIPNDISLSALQSLGMNLQSDAKNRVEGINQQIQSLGTGGGTSGGAIGGASTGATGGTIQTSYGAINPNL